MDRPTKILALFAAFVGATSIGAGVFIESKRGRGRGRGSPQPQPQPYHPSPPITSLDNAIKNGQIRPPQPATPPTPQVSPTMTADHLPDFRSQYNALTWRLAIMPLAIDAHVPIEFAEEALREESEFNPCAIGSPEQYGAGGPWPDCPREMGIYQLYNPDDLQFLKITGTELRAYCGTEKVPYQVKAGVDAHGKQLYRTVMGPSQRVARPLTAEEMGVQARGTIDKIKQSRAYADGHATASHVQWPRDGVDFWRLVKLVHGLPGLISNGLPRVAGFLGRAPSSWAEYRHTIQSGQVHCDEVTESHRGSDGFAHIFDNAERATSKMQGAAIA